MAGHHIPAHHIGLTYDEFTDDWSEHDDPHDRPTHVAVPVDEYDALIRARDVLADPEQLARDVAADFRHSHRTLHHAIVECVRRAAAGTNDGDPEPNA